MPSASRRLKIGNGLGESHHTAGCTHRYSLTDSDLWKSLAVASFLFVLNVIVMLSFSETFIVEVKAFTSSVFLSALALGIIITVGKVLSSKGIVSDDVLLTGIGVSLCQLGFGLLGGFVLSNYTESIYASAIITATAGGLVLLLAAALYVYTFNPDILKYNSVSNLLFIGGLIVLLVSEFVLATTLLWVAFALILLGWIASLVYEIGASTAPYRSVAMDGVCLYIAFTGVFVHLLQIALEVFAEDT